jgi:carboxymethylenebutenolidase
VVTRREFLQTSALVTSGIVAGNLLVDPLLPVISHAAQVNPKDPGLTSSEINFASAEGAAVGAYLTCPKGDVARPAVVVIHGREGINDQIRDVARKLAKAGYVALAPNLLSRQGATSSIAQSEAASSTDRNVDDETIIKNLNAGINYLKGQSFVGANKIGVVGFCWGGGKALLLTTRSRDLAASVIYYGTNPQNLEAVKNITAPVLGQYGGADERITSAVPQLEAAMKKYGKSFDYKIYPGAPHAFNNDTSPQSYRGEAAKEAWARTLEFFKKHLQT